MAARTIIDSVGVEAVLESESLFRGLDLADARIERFRSQAQAPVTLALEADLSAVESAAQRARDVLSGASGGQRLSLAVDVDGVDEAGQSVSALTRQIAALESQLGGARVDVGGFLRGLVEGAQEAVQEFARSTDPAVTALDRVAEGMSDAGDAVDPFAAGLRRLSQEQETARQRAEVLATANQRLLAGMSQAGRDAEAASAGSRAWAAGLATLREQAQAAEQSLAQLPAQARAIDPVAAGMARATSGALAFQVGLRRLAQEQDAARQRAELLATSNQRLIAGMAQAGREAFAASAGTRAWERGLANLRAQQAGLASGFTATSQATNKLRAGLQTIAVQASGTTPAVANLVSGLLLLGPGSTAVLGVAAGAALLATAYNLITRGSREAAEAQRELNEEFDRAVAARNPLPGLVDAAEAFNRQLTDIDAKLATLRAQQGTVVFTSDAKSGIVTRTEIDNTAEIARLEAERAQVLARMAEAGQRMSDFFAQTPQAREMAKAAEDEARARERAADAAGRLLDTVLGRFGPETALEPELTLKPRVDTAELDAALAEVTAAAEAALGQATDGGLDDELTEAEANARALGAALREVNLRLKDIGNANVSAPGEGMADFANEIRDVTRGFDALVAAGSNIGVIGEEAQRAIGSVQDLADAVANVMDNASAGNILGLIGAGVNVIGTLFASGPSEAQRIQTENTRALERLTSTIEDRFRGVGGVDQVARVAADPEFQKLAFLARAGQAAGVDLSEGFEEAMRQAGLTVADLGRIAEQVAPGLQLFDSKGRLVASALDDLAIAIDKFVEDQLKIGTAFQEQLDALNLEARIKGEPQDADAAFDRALAILRTPGLTNLDDRFAGATTDDAVREVLLGIIEDMRNGRLTPEEVGGLTREDIDLLLDLGADALEGFTDSVHRATLEMSNVPLGFRQAALAFQAQTPVSSVSGFQPVDTPLVPVRGGDGASLPLNLQSVAESIARQRPNVTIERIEIAAGDRPIRELFDEIVDEAERRSSAGGVTIRVGAG